MRSSQHSMSTPISSLTASGLTSLLSGMISQLSGQPPPPGSAHHTLSALAALGATGSSAASSSASSTASSSSTSISILQGGHTNSVLSLALNASGTLLASGGEDGHLCLWLTSENRLLKRRAIMHVSRQPNVAGNSRGRNGPANMSVPIAPVRHVVFGNRAENQHRLFVASGPCLFEIDVTRFEAGSGPYQPRLVALHDEDICQVALNDTETTLAACDAAGFVQVIELDSVAPSVNSSTLCSKNAVSPSPSDGDDACASNASTPTQPADTPFGAPRTPRVVLSVKKHAAVCSSLCFRRCSRKDCAERDAGELRAGANGFKWQLISGGQDCKLHLVEFQRAGRSVNIFDMNEFVDQDSTAYALNPPLIHTVAVTYDGAIVACGLENGNIELFDARRKNLTHLQTLYAHSQAVSKVLFVPAASSNANQNVRVNYLISAGHDGNMFCWEVKDAGVSNAAAHHGHSHNSHGQHSHHDGISIKVINCVEHWHKINWIEARSIDKVYIGDQSTQIASCSLVP